MIKHLKSADGNGTSMISLIVKAGKKISDIQKQLLNEAGKANNIKDRVNKNSVIKGINTVKERLKLYNTIPPNGLFIYCGEVIAQSGKGEGKIVLNFEPYKPIKTTCYRCDSKFVTEPLEELLVSSDRYGFIIVDGSGSLFGSLQGNSRQVREDDLREGRGLLHRERPAHNRGPDHRRVRRVQDHPRGVPLPRPEAQEADRQRRGHQRLLPG